MASKKKVQPVMETLHAPESLEGHPFYGLELDDEQKAFRDAIWDSEVRLVTVDAVAGSGKTTLAIATSCLLYHYGVVDQCIYCRTPAAEGRIGFLPGDQRSKERPYMQPLYNTIVKLDENPYTVINAPNSEGLKHQTGYWSAITDVYLLGDDIERTAFVIDEAQCMTVDQLRTILTRCHDDCKVIVIGSSLQIQGIDKSNSGFKKCIEHFSEKPWARNCHLTVNYRGELSAWADRM